MALGPTLSSEAESRSACHGIRLPSSPPVCTLNNRILELRVLYNRCSFELPRVAFP